MCLAENVAGHDRLIITLDIQKLPEISATVDCPEVSSSRDSDDDVCVLTPLEYQEYRVPCNATGDPKPIIQ